MRFPKIWFALLVGLAVGVPDLSTKHPDGPRDIRLGDVLVCVPEKRSTGIIQYDVGTDRGESFELVGRMTETPAIVRSAIGDIRLKHTSPFKDGNAFADDLSKLQKQLGPKFLCPSQVYDALPAPRQNDSTYTGALIHREPRSEAERTFIWHGKIGSGHTLCESPRRRDELRDLHDVIGLDMDSAGIMNNLPTGVIRGVCDYGDWQDNKRWQPYAAAVATVYARRILCTILPVQDKLNRAPAQYQPWTFHLEPAKSFVDRAAEAERIEKRVISSLPSRRLAPQNSPSRISVERASVN